VLPSQLKLNIQGKIMSEENPVFKVTDRRLFNPDGSPREIDEEQKAEASAGKTTEPAPATEAQSAADATTSAQSTAATLAEQTEPPKEVANSESEASATEAESAESASDDAYAQSDIPGADDPGSFVNFLMSIASNAAAALGMMEHPVTGQRSQDPELGKHWIDVLGMLEKKTRGNLSPQEQQIFQSLLSDLRMQYVALNSAPQSKAQRGFSGSDITGAK